MDRANPPILPGPETSPSDCLTDEQLAEWEEGGASLEDQERMARHIAGCEACSTLVALIGEDAPSREPSLEPSPKEPPEEELAPGARVGRYEIVRRVGAGGMGTVYAAHDPALDRHVALKLIRAQMAGPELEVRLLREAKAMARLSHPEVITVYDAGRDGDRLFIAMELVDGGTLREWLEEKPRTWKEIVAVYIRAGRGLAQAHAIGLVHRDFKPDNVLIGKDGRVRVTDFGLARSVGGPDDAPSSRAARVPLALDQTADAPLTRTGALVGTPVYMTPEQLAGKGADARTDIYAFCIALYEALYGGRPFDDSSLVAHLQEKAAGVYRTPSSDRGVPPRVRRMIVVGLSPNPQDRYASISDLLAVLVPEVGSELALPRHRRGRWVAALVAGATVLAGAGWWIAGPSTQKAASEGRIATERAVATLAGPEARLACPIFEVRAMGDVAVPLGAAAATLACARTRWELGGDPERILPPAALLDVPRQPVDDLPDPYVAPQQRARTLAVAQARASAYVDGTISFEQNAWTVDIAVRTPDGHEISRVGAKDATFLEALRRALESLWRTPLRARPIDPDVTRWGGVYDVTTALIQPNVTLLDSTAGCETLGADVDKLGGFFFNLQKMCASRGVEVAVDASAPVLDESSPEAIVASVRSLAALEAPLPAGAGARLASSLEGLRGAEPSSYGRGRLAYTAGLLWSIANDREHAQASLRLSLLDDPLAPETWELLLGAAGGGTPAAASTSAVARAWLPNDARLVPYADSWRGDELDARVRGARLAYVLEPRLVEAMHLGRALAEAGRADDAKTVAATPLDDPDATRRLTSQILGLVALHDAKLARAIPYLEEGGNAAMVDLIVVAEVAGHAEEVATRWATKFLARPDSEVDLTARGYHSPILLCMRARGGNLASRCLDRVARLGHATMNWWYEGGTALQEGARRYAEGNVRAAVDAWRSLVACPNLEVIRALPTEAFERAGEPALAARLDERKMAFTFIAGVSDAAPREAKRALARGDMARAKELAAQVVKAWEVADTNVPAVSSMRMLLRTL
jgi:hypothetical protein